MPQLKKKALIVGKSVGFFDGPNCVIVANSHQVLVDNIKIRSRSDLDFFAQALSDAWKQHVEFARLEGAEAQTSIDEKPAETIEDSLN